MEVRVDNYDGGFLELKNCITDLAIMTKNEFDRVDERFTDLTNLVVQNQNLLNNLTLVVRENQNQLKDLTRVVKQGFGIA